MFDLKKVNKVVLECQNACRTKIAADEVVSAFTNADAVCKSIAEILEGGAVTLGDGEFKLYAESAFGVCVTGVYRILNDISGLFLNLEFGKGVLPRKDADNFIAEVEGGRELILEVAVAVVKAVGGLFDNVAFHD